VPSDQDLLFDSHLPTKTATKHVRRASPKIFLRLSKSSFGKSFQHKSFSIPFHLPTVFIYLMRTLESKSRSLFFASEKSKIEDDNI
jgi:hypothetical protein